MPFCVSNSMASGFRILEPISRKGFPECKFYILENVFQTLYSKKHILKCKIYILGNVFWKTYFRKHPFHGFEIKC